MPEEKKKLIKLEDLGVKLEKKEDAPKATIITPSMAGGTEESAQETQIGELAEFAPVVTPQQQFEAESLNLIDEGIARVQNDITKRVIDPIRDKMLAARLEYEATGKVSPENDITVTGIQIAEPPHPSEQTMEEEIVPVSPPMEIEQINQVEKPIIEDTVENVGDVLDDQDRFNIDEADIEKYLNSNSDLLGEDDELEEDNLDEEMDEETKQRLKEEEKAHIDRTAKEYQDKIKRVINPIPNQYDLKQFRISTKPISIISALKKPVNTVNTASFPLLNTGRLITFSALTGDEIVSMNPENYKSRNRMFRATYSTMFKHLVDANKPTSLEAWLRSICAFDTDELHFALYGATFGKSNFITYPCDVCKTPDLVEKPIASMYKFSTSKAKEKFDNIMKAGNDTSPSALTPVIRQVSDNYAIAFQAPSIYSLIFETSMLDEKFTDKYADVLSIFPYIASIYLIDPASAAIIPIDTKPEPNNVTATAKNKIVAYYNIIKSLTPDQYALVGAKVANINKCLADKIQYQIPEHECAGNNKNKTKCTHKFAAKETGPLQMLFSRHLLVTIANTSRE